MPRQLVARLQTQIDNHLAIGGQHRSLKESQSQNSADNVKTRAFRDEIRSTDRSIDFAFRYNRCIGIQRVNRRNYWQSFARWARAGWSGSDGNSVWPR